MSIILAIESSTDLASVALHSGEPQSATRNRVPARVYCRQVNGVQSHSQTVLPMVQSVLAEAGLSLAQCSAIAFGAGPGSFTGVRTACGIAQGLGFGSDLPVLPVDTLAAAAQACRDALGSNEVLVVIDARMGQVYWGQYHWLADSETPGWQMVVAPRLDLPSAVQPVATHIESLACCGNGFAAHAAAFEGRDFAVHARADLMPHAVQIAALAQPMFAAGRALPARDAQPIYLRNDVALTTAERAIKRAEAA